jgi:hypothetical protein
LLPSTNNALYIRSSGKILSILTFCKHRMTQQQGAGSNNFCTM